MTEMLTQEDVELFPYVDDGDAKRRTHIINIAMNYHIWRLGMTTQDIVDIARSMGHEVVALCGYRWVPVHNPEKYEPCKTCFDIAGQIITEVG